MSEVQESAVVKEQIRCLISNIYDLQKLRIAAGNRLVQSFYIRLGVKPSESPEGLKDDDAKDVLKKVKVEYDRITDGIVNGGMSKAKQIKALGDELKFIRNETDYKLVEGYMLLLKAEEQNTKVLDKYVKQHPLWEKFFEPIKGCGTLMSAVCIAYFDIYKARYVSSFYRYAGLDTVQDEDKEGNKLFLTQDGTYRKVRQKYVYYYADSGEVYNGTPKKSNELDDNGCIIYTDKDGVDLDRTLCMADGNIIYEDINTNEEYVGDVVVSEHGRRMGDTEMFEYTDKSGNKAWKRGITYNPIVKTKLMGVLTGCLLKAQDPTYSTIYYDYRKRLDNSAYHKNKSDGQRNMMAQRYMIKQFLRNLWTTWRELEGLEVNYPYEVAKLGNKPHKYNQYQCEVANKY